MVLYDSWRKAEDEAWKNDCQVYGKINAEGWNEDMPSDETGSDYESMIEVIEDVGNRELFRIDFSGNQERTLDDLKDWGYTIYAERDFWYGEECPYGTFPMCYAFNKLYYDLLYSHYDILHIGMYWADVAVINQRIVNPQGKLL